MADENKQAPQPQKKQKPQEPDLSELYGLQGNQGQYGQGQYDSEGKPDSLGEQAQQIGLDPAKVTPRPERETTEKSTKPDTAR